MPYYSKKQINRAEKFRAMTWLRSKNFIINTQTESPNMDSKGYLQSYGWIEGEALRDGGLKRPILVKHKKDKKGTMTAKPGGRGFLMGI